MGSYEEQRQARIAKNKALFQQLELENTSNRLRGAASAKPKNESRPAKRQKIAQPPSRPQRISARIAASDVKPVYDEEKVSGPVLHRTSKKAKKTRAQATPTLPPTPEPDRNPADIDKLREQWASWKPSAPPPTRDANGTFHFDSHPDFVPNKSPSQMIHEGTFGGSYWRPLYSRTLRTTISDDYLELPTEWYAGLNVDRYLTNPEYDAEVNKNGVPAGQSIEAWEAAGWINHDYDVRGFFQWYCRFFQGRRCADDDRQISRWKKCVGETGRWRRILLKRYVEAGIRSVNEGDDEGIQDEERRDVSPVVHQTCLHWAWEVQQQVLDDWWESGGR